MYDDCPLQPTPDQDASSLDFFVRAQGPVTADPAAGAGGYNWRCEPVFTLGSFFERPDVTKALHLPEPNQSPFVYNMSGPASYLLYPAIVKKIRVLVRLAGHMVPTFQPAAALALLERWLAGGTF